MKPAAERAAALAERLEQAAKEGTVADIARATIDESFKERGRPSKRDRKALPDGSMPGDSGDPKSPR
jgi:hypothetical protein